MCRLMSQKANSKLTGEGRVDEGLLEFSAGESGGAAPAGTAYAAAGSSPGFSHQSVPRTSSVAAHTPEGKAVGMTGHSQAHASDLCSSRSAPKVSRAE